MALVKGTNAYCTVAEANTYFADRLDVAAWNIATPEEKAQALVTAHNYLEDLRWVGVAISEDQPSAFPRTATYFDPRLGTVVYIVNETPDRVVRGSMELAHHFLENDSVLDSTGSVSNITIDGAVTLTGIKTPAVIPPIVKRIIRPLLINGGGYAVWRAN